MSKALLGYHDAVLYRSGEPYRILAGAIHYFRVGPEEAGPIAAAELT